MIGSWSRFLVLASFSVAAACSKAESRPPPEPSSAGAAGGGQAVKIAVPGADPAPAVVDPPSGLPGGTGTPAAAPAPSGPATPDTSFKLDVAAPTPAAAGQQAVARVKVVPGAGWKMNKEYPTKLVIQPPDGVTAAKAEQVLADAATFNDHELAFDVRLTAAKPGTYKVAGTFKFAVCTDATCDPKKQAIAFDLTAK